MPATHNFTISIPIPRNQPPFALIDALHSHDPVFRHQQFIQSWERNPDYELSPEDAQAFSTPSGGQIVAYRVKEVIPILPFLGSAGSHAIFFPSLLQNTSSGLATKGKAPMGIEVYAVWTIYAIDPRNPERKLRLEEFTHLQDRVERARHYDWLIIEDCEVSCASYLMPFVKGKTEEAHRFINRKVMEDAGYVFDS